MRVPPVERIPFATHNKYGHTIEAIVLHSKFEICICDTAMKYDCRMLTVKGLLQTLGHVHTHAHTKENRAHIPQRFHSADTFKRREGLQRSHFHQIHIQSFAHTHTLTHMLLFVSNCPSLTFEYGPIKEELPNRQSNGTRDRV